MKFGSPTKGFYNVSGYEEQVRATQADKSGNRRRQLPMPKDTNGPSEDTGGSKASSSPISFTPNDKADPLDRIIGKSNTWSTLKNKLKGSLKIKSLHKKRSPLHQTNGSQPERYNLMGVLEEHARHTLDEDECKAVLRHVHTYHENKDLNRLMQLMFAILDKPEKKILLVDIRGVIAPGHVAKFDDLVEDCDLEAYEATFGAVNQVNREVTREVNQDDLRLRPDRPKHIVNGAVTDISGNFIVPKSSGDLDPKPQPRSSRNGFLQSQPAVMSESVDMHSSASTDDTETVCVSKNKIYLGLVVSGGKGPRREEPVTVVRVLPGGAAYDHKLLKPGREVTHIDGHSLAGLTPDDIESLMQKSFCNKNPINMEIKLKRL